MQSNAAFAILMPGMRRVLCVLCAMLVGGWLLVSTVQEARAAARKHILVDISDQRVYAYEGDRLAFSTWANIKGLKRGRFRVQTKKPMARSIVLGWQLPYWMGIYYVGRIENGFHGPAIMRNGTRAMNSLGCIVMPEDAARKLYAWTPLGTPVTVRW